MKKISGFKTTLAGVLIGTTLLTQSPERVSAKPTQANTVEDEVKLNGGEFNLNDRIDELKNSLKKQSETGTIYINYLFKDYIKDITIMGSNVTIQFQNGVILKFENIERIAMDDIDVGNLLVNDSGETNEPFKLNNPEIEVRLGKVKVKEKLVIIDFSSGYINGDAIKNLGIEDANSIMIHGAPFTEKIAEKISNSSASNVWLDGYKPYSEETPVLFELGNTVEDLYFNVSGAYLDVNSSKLKNLSINPTSTVEYCITAPNLEKTSFDNVDYNQSTIGNLDEFDLSKYIDESIETIPGTQAHTYDASVSYGYVKPEKVNELLYNSKVINISNYGNLSEETILRIVRNNSNLEELICSEDSPVLINSVSEELLDLLSSRNSIVHPYKKEHLKAKNKIIQDCRKIVDFMPGDKGYNKEQDEFPNTNDILTYFYNGGFTIDEGFTGNIMEAIIQERGTYSQFASVVSSHLNAAGVDSYPFTVDKRVDGIPTRKYCVATSPIRYVELVNELPAKKHWATDERLFANIGKDVSVAFGLPIDYSQVEERGWNWTPDDLQTVENKSKEEGKETPITIGGNSKSNTNEIEELYK